MQNHSTMMTMMYDCISLLQPLYDTTPSTINNNIWYDCNSYQRSPTLMLIFQNNSIDWERETKPGGDSCLLAIGWFGDTSAPMARTLLFVNSCSATYRYWTTTRVKIWFCCSSQSHADSSVVMHVGYFREIQTEIVQKYLWKILEHGVDGWRLAW